MDTDGYISACSLKVEHPQPLDGRPFMQNMATFTCTLIHFLPFLFKMFISCFVALFKHTMKSRCDGILGGFHTQHLLAWLKGPWCIFKDSTVFLGWCVSCQSDPGVDQTTTPRLLEKVGLSLLPSRLCFGLFVHLWCESKQTSHRIFCREKWDFNTIPSAS